MSQTLEILVLGSEVLAAVTAVANKPVSQRDIRGEIDVLRVGQITPEPEGHLIVLVDGYYEIQFYKRYSKITVKGYNWGRQGQFVDAEKVAQAEKAFIEKLQQELEKKKTKEK